MKPISERAALQKLSRLKCEYRREIREGYEFRAKSCAVCATPGACCLDAHFVNVHITRLEAAAIRDVLAELPQERREKVYWRVGETIEKYNLSAEGDTFEQKFACPLFEKGIGCLVHERGKPLPCIQHACYEKPEDLPPDDLLEERTAAVERLNRRCYGEPARWLPLPVAIKN
jgi:hypothetical protein